MNTPYKAALVGLGNIAWKMGGDAVSGGSLSHSAAYLSNNKTHLVAGYSPVPSENSEFHQKYNLPVYEDLAQMLDEHHPDIVSVCSPAAFHYEQVLFLLKKSVPMIWLEKPPVETVEQLRELIAVADKESKSTILVNYQRRYSGPYSRLADIVQLGTFGKVESMEFRYSKGLKANGSHMIDQIFYLTGVPGCDIEWVGKTGESDNPSFALRMSNGIPVIVSGHELPYHNIDVVVTCERTRLSILHGGMTTRQEVVKENELFPGFYRLVEQNECVLGEGGFAFANDKALEDLIQSHEERRQPISNLVTALSTQQLAEEIRERATV